MEIDQATKLMEGEIPPPNDTAAFIIERVKELRASGQQLSDLVMALEKQLAGAKRKLVETNGALDHYRADLNLLMNSTDPDPPKPPEENDDD